MELKSITEIENELVYLDGEILRHEGYISESGGGWSTPNDRYYYAGCLAERAFLLDLKNRTLCRERKLDDSGS